MKGTERKEREGREKDGKKGRVRKGEGKETGKNGVALCRLQNSCGGGRPCRQVLVSHVEYNK